MGKGCWRAGHGRTTGALRRLCVWMLMWKVNALSSELDCCFDPSFDPDVVVFTSSSIFLLRPQRPSFIQWASLLRSITFSLMSPGHVPSGAGQVTETFLPALLLFFFPSLFGSWQLSLLAGRCCEIFSKAWMTMTSALSASSKLSMARTVALEHWGGGGGSHFPAPIRVILQLFKPWDSLSLSLFPGFQFLGLQATFLAFCLTSGSLNSSNPQEVILERATSCLIPACF